MPSKKIVGYGPSYATRLNAWRVAKTCPYCESKNITEVDLECGGQKYTCNDCGAENTFRKGVKVR